MEENREDIPHADDSDSKKEGEEEATEEAPLRGEDAEANGPSELKENDAAGPTVAVKEARQKGLRPWLAKPRVMWWIAVLIAIILVSVVLAATLLTMEDTSDDYVDTTPRLMVIWPRPKGSKNYIHFRHGSLPYEGKKWPKLTSQLEAFLKNYESVSPQTNSNVTLCERQKMERNKVCYFGISTIEPQCTAQHKFGYEQGNPCIFLEFAKIKGWKPELYMQQEVDMASGVPESVKNYYKNYHNGVVFLQCRGNTVVDTENMGKVSYTPERGFRTVFFPYDGHNNYMAPFVAVQFTQPVVGVAIGITCELWAKNINHTTDSLPSGKIHFTLLVD